MTAASRFRMHHYEGMKSSLERWNVEGMKNFRSSCMNMYVEIATIAVLSQGLDALSIPERYNTKACDWYRQTLAAVASGSESPPPLSRDEALKPACMFSCKDDFSLI